MRTSDPSIDPSAIQPSPATHWRLFPIVILAALPFVHMLTLKLLGRRWWCKCESIVPWTADAWGPHNSQHLIDPYSFSHLLHGVVFYFLFNVGPMRRNKSWGLLLASLLEAGWEILENTPLIIDRYRAGTAAVGYIGDSIGNSVGDLLCCMLGWFIARRIGLLWSIVLYLALEIGCAIWIRDNLSLNVLMLLYPIDSIRQWQAGH